MPIKSFLIDIGINSTILIGIDQYWSALGIDWGSPVTDIIDMHQIDHLWPIKMQCILPKYSLKNPDSMSMDNTELDMDTADWLMLNTRRPGYCRDHGSSNPHP